MKKGRRGVMTLESSDLLDFTYRGVRFIRQTQLHERGYYLASVVRTHRTYAVTGGHSKRFPWRVVDAQGEDVMDGSTGGYTTLLHAAEGIRWHDASLTARVIA